MRLFPSPRRSAPRGAALLIVLASLVFLAALALAFLASIGTELKSSKQYADGVSAKLLSQSAFNLATDQIVAATKGYSGSDPSAPGQPLAWASQPGMIRTYDTAGNKAGYFKLYSWDVMQGTGAFDPTTSADSVSATWYQDPAIYTDLNAPVTVSGTKQFPIIDGNNLSTDRKDSTGTAVPGKTYDADGDQFWDIEGFNIDPAAPVQSGSSSNPIPMPVKWLYVLQNGEIVAPSGGTGNAATFSGSNGPTTANPIVGRVAFWTDDETCKININTASEGVYWDTPRVKSKTDDTFKLNQPVSGEYQRYPGHPAMTSLSTVIKPPASWVPGTTPPTVSIGTEVSFQLSPSDWALFQWANRIYNLTPRVGPGGSEAGTVRTAALGTGTIPTVSLDGQRLFASVDELFFQPDRSKSATLLENTPSLSKEALERARFFLTASSRAPDLNLFNTPRVGVWPIHTNTGTDYRTAFDRLIAHCLTINGHTYFFERSNSTHPTADLALNRNAQLLSYLRTLASRNVPGFGGNFAAKYPNDKDQIMTEIFDYIRSTNLADSSIPDATKRFTTGVAGTAWGTPWQSTMGLGQVVPIEDGATRGFGRYPTIQGASLLFIGTADGDDTGVSPNPVPVGNIRVQAMFIPQFFDPSVGASWRRSNFRWRVNLANFFWGSATPTTPMGFPAATYPENRMPVDTTGYGDQFGVNQVNKPVSTTIDLPKAQGSFQFSGGDVTIEILDPSGSTVLQTIVLFFPPGPFPLPALAPNEVYSVPFGQSPPQGTAYNFRSFSSRASAAANTFNAGSWILDKRLEKGPGGVDVIVNESPDVIRSVGLKAGDPRIVAALKTIDSGNSAKYFGTINSGRYNSTAAGDRVFGMHNLVDGYGRPYYGCAMGRLVTGVNYLGYSSGVSTRGTSSLKIGGRGKWGDFDKSGVDFTFAADTPLDGVAAGSTTAATSSDIPGDWDNAPFDVRDGPYINKADEGDSGGSREPYNWKQQDKSGGNLNASLFTPNRQIPSAVTFGSLPTGVKGNRPWQTLLFRPQPGHPGSKGYAGDGTASPNMPGDHLLLDLFHMPVVEPYAISEPLSTAGRINMNTQILPFTYINRATGIYALLKAEKLIAINDSQAGVYKVNDYTTSPAQSNIRLGISPSQTLLGFQARFATNDIFRSPTEICELPIVPAGGTYAGMATFWSDKRITGDNSKERIYATLYPRLTTKSNTYTIHAKVQTLKKLPGTTPNVWTEGKDQVTGEYRGSQTIERFVDPNNPNIPDYAQTSVTTPISSFYRTRVISSKQFTP